MPDVKSVTTMFFDSLLIALKHFMYKHDTRRMLQMAHQRYDQTGLEQWNHSEKWSKYCNVCKSREELKSEIKISIN